MLSRPRLTTTCKAAVGFSLLLMTFTACKHSEPAKAPPAPPPPKVKYSKTYDAQIKEIMDLASKRHWEEAETKADALYQEAPDNPFISRVHNWVKQEGQKIREQALEEAAARGDAARVSGALSADRSHESLSVRIPGRRVRPLPLCATANRALPRAHFRAVARSHRFAG
jgi:hypothetical protein